MTPEQLDLIARAGFEASNHIQRWEDVGDDERQRWRLAAPYTTPQTIRAGRFTGYYGMANWEDLAPKTRMTWHRIAAAMGSARIRAGVTITDIEPNRRVA